ncbi:GyrI-like domain-containing protein [Vibrio parahaemolyticus]|uniref:GyrI-like domain-containing protein n=1 Tax=Vibrio harveyi group TaxID=717610 RepID=UPI00046ED2E9|nr:GyrI-like domain-containing protein [Vibrio parahaemolyticus]HAT8521901.1 AraC family transcriptional regulator [Vibrio vulnificus]EGU0149412.1 GyrI-like domain-containing protein [Vibrio parahaemolyticus]MDG2845023.1 GyrI-like domain-containing protein [Vibrio parahaemolyticus]MDG2865882.1 GyrI-like domain-containing protein [Vibrio parahaemolyticus]TOG33043.1 AraC family transcriptional regulator [Vibrio parahaemolyticus]
MEVVEVKGFEIQGLALRTRNEIEMNPETANIPKHVEYVDTNVVIDYQSGARAYSVYCNYESDVNGYFDVLMGSDEISSSNVELSSVSVLSGSYLKFESEGEFPAAVIAAWQSVWSYFSSQSCEHERAYTTDFEHYESASKVSVYIALK